jgi:hypothetical protein
LADAAALASAKLGIVIASAFAVVAALVVGFLGLPRKPDEAAATSAEAAEASAEA